jgi:hypothetical protein
MPSYYDSNKATSANSRNLILSDSEKQHFPFEGLYVGSLTGGKMELPALCISVSRMVTNPVALAA